MIRNTNTYSMTCHTIRLMNNELTIIRFQEITSNFKEILQGFLLVVLGGCAGPLPTNGRKTINARVPVRRRPLPSIQIVGEGRDAHNPPIAVRVQRITRRVGRGRGPSAQVRRRLFNTD